MCCCVPIPCYVNFPLGLFLLVALVLITLITVFVALDWSRFSEILLFGTPLWTWSVFLLLVWISYFGFWALFYTIREGLITRHYFEWMKVTYFLFGIWSSLTWLCWSATNFACLELLAVWGLDRDVYFWISRIMLTLLVMFIFWFVWELSLRFIVMCIEKESLWQRLAMLVWHEVREFFSRVCCLMYSFLPYS